MVRFVPIDDEEKPIRFVPIDDEMGRGTAALKGLASGVIDTGIGIPDYLLKQAVNTVFPQERDQLLGMQLAPRGVQGMLGEDRVIPLSGGDFVPGIDEAREQHPMVTGLSEAVGPGLALLMGRAPLVRGDVMKAGPEVGALAAQIGQRLTQNPGLARAISEQMQRPAMQSLARGAGRAAETSLEGAVISALQGGDPLETAAFAAGGQAISSAALGGVKGLLSGDIVRVGGKLTMTAVALGGLVQVGKEAIPGGRDRILESMESGYTKVMYGLALGTMAGALGAGRLNGRNMPILMDGITSVPRGVALSVLDDVLRDQERGVNTTERAINHLIVNPDQFNKTQRTQMEKAIEEGNFGATLARMIETDPRFARVMDTEPGAFPEKTGLTRGQRKQLQKARER